MMGLVHRTGNTTGRSHEEADFCVTKESLPRSPLTRRVLTVADQVAGIATEDAEVCASG